MASVSLQPIARNRWGFGAAQHLLNRAGFGGTAGQIQALASMRPDEAVKYVVDYPTDEEVNIPGAGVDQDIMRPLTDEERRELARARRRNDEETLARYQAIRNQRMAQDREQLAMLQQWWLGRMIESPRPLQEKLTLLWHGHFAVNYRGCQDSYLLYQQNQKFRGAANDSFATLAQQVVRDPAMLIFLNNDRNVERQPNENLAREMMELFTLGEGHYTEKDIHEAARALTGYTYRDNDFYFAQHEHDKGGKEILGRRGVFDGDDFAKICLGRDACPWFVAYKLYRHFAGDIGRPDELTEAQKIVIGAMGRSVRKHEYRLKPVLTELFLSEHFYDETVMGRKIKSPAELVAGLMRTLRTPVRDAGMVSDAMRMMGQELFNPPNVSGWAGGRAWINTSTLFIRQNVATYLITGKAPFKDGWKRSEMGYDATGVLEDSDERGLTPAAKQLPGPGAERVVDRVLGLLLGAAGTGHRREEMLGFLARHENRITNDVMAGLLCVVTAMPEYQLC
ncbi:MAG: DUF1800 domain-containing protein [Phycisphaeraceae bacterium]